MLGSEEAQKDKGGRDPPSPPKNTTGTKTKFPQKMALHQSAGKIPKSEQL